MYRTMSPIYLSLKLHKTSAFGTLLRWFFKKFASIAYSHSTVKLFIIYFSLSSHMPWSCFYCVFSYYRFKVWLIRSIGHRSIIAYTLEKYPLFYIFGLVKPWFVNRGFGYSYRRTYNQKVIKTLV